MISSSRSRRTSRRVVEAGEQGAGEGHPAGAGDATVPRGGDDGRHVVPSGRSSVARCSTTTSKPTSGPRRSTTSLRACDLRGWVRRAHERDDTTTTPRARHPGPRVRARHRRLRRPPRAVRPPGAGAPLAGRGPCPGRRPDPARHAVACAGPAPDRRPAGRARRAAGHLDLERASRAGRAGARQRGQRCAVEGAARGPAGRRARVDPPRAARSSTSGPTSPADRARPPPRRR